MTKHRTPRVPAHQRSYEVGYGKPPEKFNFKPGQVANPKGRPKETMDLRETVIKLLNRKLKAPQGGKTFSLIEGLLNAQAAKGLKGDTKATNLLLRLSERALGDADTGDKNADLDADSLQIIEDFVRRLGEAGQLPSTKKSNGGSGSSGAAP